MAIFGEPPCETVRNHRPPIEDSIIIRKLSDAYQKLKVYIVECVIVKQDPLLIPIASKRGDHVQYLDEQDWNPNLTFISWWNLVLLIHKYFQKIQNLIENQKALWMNAKTEFNAWTS